MSKIALAIDVNLYYTLIKYKIRLLKSLSSFSFSKRFIFRYSFRGTFRAEDYTFFCYLGGKSMQYIDDNKSENYLNLLATRLAEVRLSELGYRFIPGIYPLFKHFKRFIEARARIVKPQEGGCLLCLKQ